MKSLKEAFAPVTALIGREAKSAFKLWCRLFPAALLCAVLLLGVLLIMRVTQ